MANKIKRIFLGLIILTFLVGGVAFAWYPARYTESAHGDASSGVKRKTGESSADYGKGNCAHCHSQHAGTAYDFALFAQNNPTSQTDNFCFQCHCNPVASKQSEMIENKDYGSTFGGGTANSDDIKQAFDFGPPLHSVHQGSSHNLEKMRNWVMNTAHGDWMTTDTNACLACHNAHYAQQNHSVQSHPQGEGVKTAIRRTKDENRRPRNQWGDDSSDALKELMSEYTSDYQAPYWEGSTSAYEPGEDTIANGSNLPNYVNFCTRCHQNTIAKGKTDAYGGQYGLQAINWGAADGNFHGKKEGSPKFLFSCQNYDYSQLEVECFDQFAATPGPIYGCLKPPYNDPTKNYVLCCTDCHEPHGSPNPFLLRTCVNGKDVSYDCQHDSAGWYEFCTACHYIYAGGDCNPHMWFVDPTGGWCPDDAGCGFGGACHQRHCDPS